MNFVYLNIWYMTYIQYLANFSISYCHFGGLTIGFETFLFSKLLSQWINRIGEWAILSSSFHQLKIMSEWSFCVTFVTISLHVLSFFSGAALHSFFCISYSMLPAKIFAVFSASCALSPSRPDKISFTWSLNPLPRLSSLWLRLDT